MQIELHNDTYFHPKPSTVQSKTPNKPSIHINELIFQPQETKLPTVNEPHNHTDTTPHDTKITTIINMPSKTNTPTTLYQRISNSTDKSFFILFTPANTLAH